MEFGKSRNEFRVAGLRTENMGTKLFENIKNSKDKFATESLSFTFKILMKIQKFSTNERRLSSFRSVGIP